MVTVMEEPEPKRMKLENNSPEGNFAQKLLCVKY